MREDIAVVLEPLGLRRSAQDQIVHTSESLDFLGFRIQWRRKRGTSKWYVYTLSADRLAQSLKDKAQVVQDPADQPWPTGRRV